MKAGAARFAAGYSDPRAAHLAGLNRILNSGLTFAELRSASPMEEDAQRIIDQAVVRVGLERLVVAADILAAGLTYPLTDPLSVMEVQWEQISKQGGAQRTMTPSARGENHLADRRQKRIPVYLTTDDFSLGVRSLRASQRVGSPLDVSGIEDATRRVNEAIEDAALNGGPQADGYTSPGILNGPNANAESLGVDWTGTNTIGTTGPAIIEDVLSMISTLQADKKFGPYNLYVGTKAGNLLQGDFKVNTSDTILDRIKRIEAGGRMINVRVADQMPGAATGVQCAMVQMTSDVVDMITGQEPTVVPWMSPDGFTLYWLVMAIMVPRVRDDYDGNSGIVVGTKA